MLNDFFGEVISVYSDQDAIDDGVIVNVAEYGVKFNGKPVNRMTCGAADALDTENKQPETIANNLKFIADNSEKDREGADAWGIFKADPRLGNEKFWLVGNEIDGYTILLPSEY